MHESAHVWDGQGFDRRRSTPYSMHNDCPRQLVSAHLPIPSTLRCHSTAPRPFIRHRPYPSRPHQWTIRAPDDRCTRPARAEPKSRRLHPSLDRVISIHVSISPHIASPPMRLGSSDPSLPIQRRFSRSTFSESPRIRLWCAQATRCRRSGPNARKIRTLRTASWSRPRRRPRPAHIDRRVLVHALRQAITILRPKPSPRHFYEHPVLRRLLPSHPRT
ncbi:hypothetical protein K438DRAFT_770419 [Mycena galopus ATCC 62051]|nr:hypothetical protein K438DRAFT_770419 [Mycena galopus ATCC 62051]